MLNRIVCSLLTVCVLLGFLAFGAGAENLTLSAESAILLNAETGEIIYEKNAYEQRGMASTTKIMTALLALETDRADDVVTVNAEDVAVEGTSIGLKAGDKITLGVLVAGMLLESGNDAANVTATAVAGSKEAFVDLMNEKAREIGMTDTVFKNPSGLTEDGHCSTAYDMALLACRAIKNKDFREFCSQKSMRVTYGEPEYQRTFTNHNKLLSSVEGAFGVKTGFTKASGRCLVSAAERDGVTLVAVTLCAPNDWDDHKELFEYGFSNVKVQKAEFDAGEISVAVVGSEKKSINTYLSGDLAFSSAKTDLSDVSVQVYCEKFIYAGIEKGDVVGIVKAVNSDGTVLAECSLLAAESAPLSFTEKTDPPTVWEKIKKFREGLSD